MTNFLLPTNTTLVSEILQILRERDESIAAMDYSDDTNIKVGFIRYNRINRTFEEWDGTAWNDRTAEPAGIIKQFAGTTAPRGHLICNGEAVNTYTYRNLHAVISSTYGGTAYQDGVTNQPGATTTFILPDLQGRFALGKTASGVGSNLGSTGGTLNHTHTVKAHNHGMGAGADLNIDTGGTHTTSIDIYHDHDASAALASSGVNIPGGGTGQGQVVLNDPGHNHRYYAQEDSISGSQSDRPLGAAKTRGNRVVYTTLTDPTGVYLSNGGVHTHTVTLSDPGHTHTVDVVAVPVGTVRTHTDGSHKHLTSTIKGRIGLVTNGVDGNTSQPTEEANPPFIALNYIITI